MATTHLSESSRACSSDAPFEEKTEVVVGLVGFLDQVAEVHVVGEDQFKVLIESVDP